jgi:hypothetical protein
MNWRDDQTPTSIRQRLRDVLALIDRSTVAVRRRKAKAAA